MNNQLESYLRLAQRWWWLLIISAVIPAVIARVFISRQPNYYMAKATVSIGMGLQNPKPDQWQFSIADTLANGYASLVKERQVTQKVVERLQLDRQPEALAQQVTTQVYPDAQLLVIMVTDGDPQAAALIANALATELVRLSPVSQEDYQRRRAFIQVQLDDLEKRINQVNEEIDRVSKSLIELTSAAELQEANDRLTQLETAKRDYQTAYADLLASYGTDSPNILAVFDWAAAPTAPLPRKDNLTTVIAALAGLALGVTGVLLIEYLDDAMRWEGESKRQVLGVPVLGAIAKMSNKSGSAVKELDPRSPAAEMVRTVRTNILLAAGERPLKQLVVTSPEMQAGKTFVVAQLGLAIASKGNRVILVDADLRTPSLHELFDLPNLSGTSTLLDESAPLTKVAVQHCLQKTGKENLYLLSGGKPSSDPGALLLSPRLGELLQLLQTWADIVLIDSPPAAAALDAILLSLAADGIVLVVSSGTTSQSKANIVKERLTQQGKSKLLGVIFNRVNVDVDGYHYYPRESDQHRRSLLSARLPFAKRAAQEDTLVTLGLSEMAECLGVSRTTARRWCESAKLPAFKSGADWRIKEADLQTALQQLGHKE